MAQLNNGAKEMEECKSRSNTRTVSNQCYKIKTIEWKYQMANHLKFDSFDSLLSCILGKDLLSAEYSLTQLFEFPPK